MNTHFEQCFDIEEHNEILEYLQYLKSEMGIEDRFMIEEVIIHIEFLYTSIKESKQ
jgi:Glu-tRNA(Gln) amidotransferase subunit E-like FAD-binding protein